MAKRRTQRLARKPPCTTVSRYVRGARPKCQARGRSNVAINRTERIASAYCRQQNSRIHQMVVFESRKNRSIVHPQLAARDNRVHHLFVAPAATVSQYSEPGSHQCRTTADEWFRGRNWRSPKIHLRRMVGRTKRAVAILLDDRNYANSRPFLQLPRSIR